MLFPEFTAGELLVRSCRSALQARIAAESRSYSKIFCNDQVNIQVDHVSLDSTAVKVHPDGTGALKKTVHNRLVNRAQAGQPKFTWLLPTPERP